MVSNSRIICRTRLGKRTSSKGSTHNEWKIRSLVCWSAWGSTTAWTQHGLRGVRVQGMPPDLIPLDGVIMRCCSWEKSVLWLILALRWRIFLPLLFLNFSRSTSICMYSDDTMHGICAYEEVRDKQASENVPVEYQLRTETHPYCEYADLYY